MPITNYPTGFPQGLSVRGLPLLSSYPGQVFWVDSVYGGNDGTFDSPFTTVTLALARCVADRGDIIMVKAGHAETISSATSLLLNKAGVAIIGLGAGTKRPTFTFTTANTARIPVSVDNVSIQNCRFIGNFLSIATCFLLTTAANFTVDTCDFADTSAILGFLSIITTTVSVNSDNLTFTNNRRISLATTTPGPDIVVANTMTGLTVVGNQSYHTTISNNVAALIAHGALVMTAAFIANNDVYSVNTDTATGGVLVTTSATTGSGIIKGNRVRALDVAAEIMVTATAVQYGMFDNLYIGDGTYNSGFVSPAIGSTA